MDETIAEVALFLILLFWASLSYYVLQELLDQSDPFD